MTTGFTFGFLLFVLIPPLGFSQPAVSHPDAPASNDQLAVNPLTGLTSASAKNYESLTGRERLELYWKQNYWSIGAYFGPVLSALVLDQATGSPHEWGGGVEGFGRRVGSRTLSSTIEGSVQAVLAAPLHEDVRYISLGEGGFGHRILHACAFSFLTYNNHGHTTLNIANLTGYFAAAAASTTWVPLHESAERYTWVHGAQQMGFAVPVNIVQEFWPDVRRKVLHRHP